MFSDFPSLHPLIVHFPIVLILLSVAFQVVVVWKDWEQIRWATLFIMFGAFLSALAASTIFHADPSEDAPKAAMEIFAQHEAYAQYTLWVSGITLAMKAIGDFYKINRRSYHCLVLISALFSAIFLSIAGHHGAKLTHVAGVGPMGRYLMKEHGGKESTMDMNAMKDTTKEDTNMMMNDTMPEMQKVSENKSLDDMQNMKGMKQKNMKEKMNMKGMDNMKQTGKEKNKMEMQNMGSMKGMDNMDNTKQTDKKKNMDGMQNMDNMKGMDSTTSMKSMKNDKSMSMPGMDMSNPMDTFKFEDNNPGLKQKKK